MTRVSIPPPPWSLCIAGEAGGRERGAGGIRRGSNRRPLFFLSSFLIGWLSKSRRDCEIHRQDDSVTRCRVGLFHRGHNLREVLHCTLFFVAYKHSVNIKFLGSVLFSSSSFSFFFHFPYAEQRFLPSSSPQVFQSSRGHLKQSPVSSPNL